MYNHANFLDQGMKGVLLRSHIIGKNPRFTSTRYAKKQYISTNNLQLTSQFSRID